MSDPLRAKSVDLLRRLSEASGAPGGETAVRALFKKEIGAPHYLTDRQGSIAAVKEGPTGSPRVLVCGHLDEVGFMVRTITDAGFLQFVPLGGWWTHTLLAQRVRIVTADEQEIPGVISSVPPHFLTAEQRNAVLPIDKLYIDIGASSREEAESFGVAVGDHVVPDVQMTTMRNPDILVGKAFDNRVGMAVAIETAQTLADTDLPCTLMTAGTVQEEVGTRGAKTLAALCHPDVALVLEAPPADDTPGMPRDTAQGKFCGGVQIRVMDPTAIMNRALVRWVKDVAREEQIPHQVTVRHSGGTDAGALQFGELGVPCIVIGVPSRYIHTHHSMIHMKDYEAACALMVALVKRMNRSTVDQFTAF